MAEDKLNPNIATAQRVQEKFEFYLLALTFTVLGLSIQTANFSQNIYSDFFELAGWLLLLASGISGLLRIEWVPVQYHLYYKTDKLETERDYLLNCLNQGLAVVPVSGQGEPQPINDLLEKKQDFIDKIKPELKKSSKKQKVGTSFKSGGF